MKPDVKFEAHGLFDARVPRYTSYPPANRFEQIEDERLAANWMGRTPPGSELSFYLHIPFCRRLCWFCACRTQGTKSDAPLNHYLSSLEREMQTAAKHLLSVRAKRVHIGGGTPTLMTPEMVVRLMSGFDAMFPRAADAEFSVEIDPTEVDQFRLEAFAKVGMTRASLGVQDFEQDVQAAIGREQSLEETADCIRWLRELGVDSINLDILYGLPFQTEATLLETVEKVIDLDPERIAGFGYAHVPWMSRRQKLIPEDALPGARKRLSLFSVMAARLKQAGYVQIGVDHFVKPQDTLARALAQHRLHRNFQGYTDDANSRLIGFGASAISRYPEGYLHNATSTAEYLAMAEQAGFATRRGIALTKDHALTAELIEQLMCYGQIDLARLVNKTIDLASARRQIESLAQAFPDLVKKVGDRVHVPSEFYPMLRIMAARLDDHQTTSGAHALAV